MNLARRVLSATLLTAFLMLGQIAQSQVPDQATIIPRVVQFSGSVDTSTLPTQTYPQTVTLVFSLYAYQDAPTPIFTETQLVPIVDASGRYTVGLGSQTSSGMPFDPFVTVSATWIGVSVNSGAELPRTMLTSAPYAMKAGDADTLGGLPARAFLSVAYGPLSNSMTTATEQNLPGAIVARDIQGNFAANVITGRYFMGDGSYLSNIVASNAAHANSADSAAVATSAANATALNGLTADKFVRIDQRPQFNFGANFYGGAPYTVPLMVNQVDAGKTLMLGLQGDLTDNTRGPFEAFSFDSTGNAAFAGALSTYVWGPAGQLNAPVSLIPNVLASNSSAIGITTGYTDMGTMKVAYSGVAGCRFPSTPTVGDFVTVGADGLCSDAGTSVVSGTQVVGIVFATSADYSGIHKVLLNGGVRSALSGVASFAGRTGAITPAVGDYAFPQIGGSVSTAQLPSNLAYTDQTNTFSTNQTVNGTLTANSFRGDGSQLSAVNAATLGGSTVSSFATAASVTNEAASRQTADSSLQAALNSEATSRQSNVASLQSSIDVLNVNTAKLVGNTFSGKQNFAAATSTSASIAIAPGTAPSSPSVGDMWNASGVLQYRDSANSTRSVVTTPHSSGMQFVKLTATITPAAVAAGTCTEQTFTFAGVASGDMVAAFSQPTSSSPGANIALGGERVGGANSLSVQFCNLGKSNSTPTAGVYSVVVIR